jgi:Flp pilus assembly protein TadD
MAALWAYAFYAEKPKLSSYFICLLLFILSLLSKSMLITLPFVLLLLDYWPLKRWQKEITGPRKNILLNRLIGEKIPFLLLTIIFSMITFLVQYEANTVYPSLTIRIFNAIVAYGAYLGKTVWPVDLTLNYFYLYSFDIWQITVSFLILSIITAVVIYFIKRRPFLFVGWFWYLGTLVPVIGLVPTSALLADHYTYLSSIGIAVMLSWGIPSITGSEDAKRKILFPAAILVLAVLIILTWNQCGYWKNGIELWNHAVKVTRNNILTRNNSGFAIFAEKNIEEALPQKRAISIRQDSFLYYNRGNAYAEKGQYQPAIDDYNEALRLQPNFTSAYFNRGNVYKNLGQYKMAIKDYNNTIRLSPDFIVAYNFRGLDYGKLGEYELALENFNEAIRLKPDYASAYNNRGFTYYCRIK